MIRRDFLKLLGALPFVSFFSAKRPRTINFDPEKSYRNWVVITDIKDLDEAHRVVMKNAKLLIPPEFHDKISVCDTFYPNNGNVGPIRVIGWYYNIDFKDHPNWKGAECKKCKDTGRLWSNEVPTLIGITQVSVKSCDCEAGAKRERRLSA